MLPVDVLPGAYVEVGGVQRGHERRAELRPPRRPVRALDDQCPNPELLRARDDLREVAAVGVGEDPDPHAAARERVDLRSRRDRRGSRGRRAGRSRRRARRRRRSDGRRAGRRDTGRRAGRGRTCGRRSGDPTASRPGAACARARRQWAKLRASESQQRGDCDGADGRSTTSETMSDESDALVESLPHASTQRS